MRPLTACQCVRQAFRHMNQGLIRRSSTQPDYKHLLDRKPNLIFDYLTPTQSHLLNITLADFLPESDLPDGFDTSDLTLPSQSRHPQKLLLPHGHHLVYFPPQVLSRDLLEDGTDPLQSPGSPFVKRMWAGGSITFRNKDAPGKRDVLFLGGRRAACSEKITNVSVVGEGEKQKVFVTIERAIGYDFTQEKNEELTTLLLEQRNLVFMKEKTEKAAQESVTRPDRVILPIHEPDRSVKIRPTKSLLFRFSALTFNAHGIHLDPQYCREVEGYRNLLVHGPLSVVLMLSVLRGSLQEGEDIYKLDYRNLTPLYVDEGMRVCVKRIQGKPGELGTKIDVWIEGTGGGYAVKGTAFVGPKEKLEASS